MPSLGTLPTDLWDVISRLIYQNPAKSEVRVYCVCRRAVLEEYLWIVRENTEMPWIECEDRKLFMCFFCTHSRLLAILNIQLLK